MTIKRPASHIFVIILFFSFAMFTGIGSYLTYKQEGIISFWNIASTVAFIFGLWILSVNSKLAYYYCAVIMLLISLFLLGSMSVLFYKLESTEYTNLIPTTVFGALILWINYSFAFGEASKAYFKTNKA